MMRNVFGEGITFRHWLAWKLQRAAWCINRIYDGETEERIAIYDRHGDALVAEWLIKSDVWRHGTQHQKLNPLFGERYRIEWGDKASPRGLR